MFRSPWASDSDDYSDDYSDSDDDSPEEKEKRNRRYEFRCVAEEAAAMAAKKAKAKAKAKEERRKIEAAKEQERIKRDKEKAFQEEQARKNAILALAKALGLVPIVDTVLSKCSYRGPNGYYFSVDHHKFYIVYIQCARKNPHLDKASLLEMARSQIRRELRKRILKKWIRYLAEEIGISLDPTCSFEESLTKAVGENLPKKVWLFWTTYYVLVSNHDEEFSSKAKKLLEVLRQIWLKKLANLRNKALKWTASARAVQSGSDGLILQFLGESNIDRRNAIRSFS